MSTVTALSRKFWVDTLLGWAEDRLPGPQLDECRAALDFSNWQARAQGAEAGLLELRRVMNVIAYEPIGQITDSVSTVYAAIVGYVALCAALLLAGLILCALAWAGWVMR